MPLIVKLSGFDHHNAVYPWKGLGTQIEESVEVARLAERSGASAIHVSTGSMFPHPWNPAGYMPVDMGKRTYGGVVDSGKYTLPLYLAFRFAGPAVRLVWERALRKRLYRSFGDYLRGRQPDAAPYAWELLEGLNRAAARAIKKSVGIPVLCTGAFQSQRGIEAALASDCDAVTIARPLVANPDLPNRLKQAIAGNATDYRPPKPCSLCNRCLLAVLEHPFGCYDERRYQSYDEMIERVMAIYRG
jgi:2,4-dienoyl-CoA reductase (NADPH2)